MDVNHIDSRIELGRVPTILNVASSPVMPAQKRTLCPIIVQTDLLYVSGMSPGLGLDSGRKILYFNN